VSHVHVKCSVSLSWFLFVNCLNLNASNEITAQLNSGKSNTGIEKWRTVIIEKKTGQEYVGMNGSWTGKYRRWKWAVRNTWMFYCEVCNLFYNTSEPTRLCPVTNTFWDSPGLQADRAFIDNSFVEPSQKATGA